MGWLLIIVGFFLFIGTFVKPSAGKTETEAARHERVLRHKGKWRLAAGLLLLVGVGLIGEPPGAQKATELQSAATAPSAAISIPAPSSEQKEAPLPVYSVKGPSAYGAPGVGKIGNSYWISIPGDPPEPAVRRVVQHELNKRRMEMVVYQDGSAWRPTELSFFVYTRPSDFTKQPKVPGEEAADYGYVWTPSKDLQLTLR